MISQIKKNTIKLKSKIPKKYTKMMIKKDPHKFAIKKIRQTRKPFFTGTEISIF